MRQLAAGVLSASCLLVIAPPLPAHEPLDGQVESLTRRIEAAPDDAGLLMRRGELHRLRGRWRRALSDYREARRLDPGLDAVDLCLGQLWLDRGRPRRAVRSLDRFLARRGRHGGALAARARARRALGDPLGAADDFTRAIQAEDRGGPRLPDYYLERARALMTAGPDHLDTALRGLEEGAARLSWPASLTTHLIDLEVRAGRFDEALSHLDRIASHATRRDHWDRRRLAILALAAGAGR